MSKIRAAIYIRVSTEEQAEEGFSLPAQETTLRKYCEMRKWEVVKIYADAGLSAKDIYRRPQMRQMLSDAQAGAFDTLIVWKITRFTRSLSDLCSAFEVLCRYDVSLVSYSEAFDCSTPAGRMMMNILGTIAQWEREVISENVSLAMNERAMQGLRTCSYALGYDIIKKGDMTINEPEAEIIRFIFAQYLKTKNLTDVAALCNQHGYCGKKGNPFSAYSVAVVLTRFLYCGYYSWHRQPIKGNFPAIISAKDYNRAQRILQSQGRAYGRERKEPLIFLKE